jgi:hypothetical protein
VFKGHIGQLKEKFRLGLFKIIDMRQRAVLYHRHTPAQGGVQVRELLKSETSGSSGRRSGEVCSKS